MKLFFVALITCLSTLNSYSQQIVGDHRDELLYDSIMKNFSVAWDGNEYHHYIFLHAKLLGTTSLYRRYSNSERKLSIDDSSGEDVFIRGSFTSVILDFGTFKTIGIRDSVKRLSLLRSTIDELQIVQTTISDLQLKGVICKKIRLEDVAINGYANFNQFTLPESIELSNVDLLNLKGELNMSDYVGATPEKICRLILRNVDISKINLRYTNMKLAFPDSPTKEDKIFIYQSLLNNFRTRGLYESYEKLDKEFKEFKYKDSGRWYGSVLNWIDRTWWDYGYNKFLVIKNGILLNILFFFINLFLYKKLLTEVYKHEKFIEINEQINSAHRNKFRRLLTTAPYILLYTSYIFWGLRLDIGALSIKRIGFLVYVLVQYVLGIICLAYIANLIITV